MDRRIVLVCVATLSCRGDAPPPPLAAPSPRGVPANAAPVPLDVHPSAPASTIVIRDIGVGPIGSRTTAADLVRILPELERDGELRWDHEADRDLAQTWFSRDGQHVLSVYMDLDASRPLVRVSVSDRAVSTEAGARVGQSVAELVRIYPDLNCTFEKELRRNGAVETTLLSLTCATPLLPHVQFAVAVASFADRRPGAVHVAELAGQIVNTIVWTPD